MSNQLIESLPGLVAWFPHTKGGGTTLYDYSGNAHNGTITTAVWKKNPTGAYSLDYNGSANVNLGDLNAIEGGNISIAAWIKKDSDGTRQDIVCKATTSNGAGTWFFAVDATNVLRFQITPSGNEIAYSSNTVLASDGWTHVAATHDGTTMRVYINGVEDGTHAYSGNIPTNTENLFIGRNQKNTTSGFDGRITDVFLSDEVWSPELINEIYTKTYRS